MFTLFQTFLSPQDFLKQSCKNVLCGNANKKNLLIHDDNLNAMQFLLQKSLYKGKVDLVYIDPPFGTNNIFRLGGTMSSSKESLIAYKDKFNIDSYLEFLYYRLLLIKELMSEKGSLYLHIDTKMGHYVKVLCDEIFGREHFINDITRIKCNPKNFTKKGMETLRI